MKAYKIKFMTPMTEHHFTQRIGWIRASVLGANDGIVSIASLVVGVSAAQMTNHEILLTSIAGLVAGTISMAAGEYVSVSSQSDSEKADLEREKQELKDHPESELLELRQIYIQRGLSKDLASKVAQELTAHDALGAHLRDELGFSNEFQARPLQAAASSAVSFLAGGLPFVLMVALMPLKDRPLIVSLVALFLLISLGAISARVGGAPILKAMLRVSFWGMFALATTAAIGHFIGVNL